MSELEQKDDIFSEDNFEDLLGDDGPVDDVETDLPMSPDPFNVDVAHEPFEFEVDENGRVASPHSPQDNADSIVISTDAYNELVEIKSMMTEFVQTAGDLSILQNEVARLKSILDHTLTQLSGTQNDLSDLSGRHNSLNEAYRAFYTAVNTAE